MGEASTLEIPPERVQTLALGSTDALIYEMHSVVATVLLEIATHSDPKRLLMFRTLVLGLCWDCVKAVLGPCVVC